MRAGFERAAERRGVTTAFRYAGQSRPTTATIRDAVRALLAEGVTAIVLHCAEDVHQGVLDALADAGLSVPGDISIVSVGSSFDTAALSTPLDSIPLVPAESCELAVELAVAALSGSAPEPGVHLIAPHYLDVGSVAAPSR
ncbi:substrate-binding domain-containing protein [Microbacterium sp. RG1]|uniref:substrate-binding domain-containing protein n=1 Tax=Microbacterium sp. RG1 TaxID=2489212 RepID=UPI001EE39839|nr:substrate-binding domain-containing protein [Microbacterium sp. RG1]